MEFFDNHKALFGTAFGLFVTLTVFVAILPALNNQTNNAVLPGAKELSIEAELGKRLFVANGCVACHTQQVRNVDMDKMWGSRPSIAADYAANHRMDFWRNTATLMGTERTGPDLTNIGARQPSIDWHLVHLYNPRSVVKESIMPAYSWLFVAKDQPGENDVVVNVPPEFTGGETRQIVATAEALQLVAYLQSLSQTVLPDGNPVPEFLYKRAAKQASAGGDGGEAEALVGASLYVTNCQACHQANGEGLKGAFPALKGSKIVVNDDPEQLVNVIMYGYNGRAAEGYGIMPAVGTNNNLTPEQVTAIINHERTSWGNSATKVSLVQVKKIMDSLKTSKPTNKPTT